MPTAFGGKTCVPWDRQQSESAAYLREREYVLTSMSKTVAATATACYGSVPCVTAIISVLRSTQHEYGLGTNSCSLQSLRSEDSLMFVPQATAAYSQNVFCWKW